MTKERINISVDQEIGEMLRSLAEVRHSTVSQLITDWTLVQYREMKAWERLDSTCYVQGELDLAVDEYLASHPEADPAAVKRDPELLRALLDYYRCKTNSELLEEGALAVNDPDNPVFA